MAERMTRYQLAFAPFLNKYINDELSKHYGGRRDGDVFEKIPFAKGMAVFHGADYQAERKRNQHG